MRTTRPAAFLLSAHCCVALLSACGSSRSHDAVDTSENPSEIVLLTLRGDATEGYYTDGFVCSTAHQPFALGTVDSAVQSPDGSYAAVARNGGVDIVTLSDQSFVTLPAGTTPEGLRWSDASDRLAFFSDGAPMLAAPDGSELFAVDVAIPETATSLFQESEWSKDGQRVAFVTRGLGILADADGGNPRVFSEKMVGPYGTPWGVAFSPDGRYLAGLESEEPAQPTRPVLLLDLDTFTARHFENVLDYSLTGFLADSSAVGLWDTNARLWLLPTGAGEPKQFEGWGSRQSPATREVARGAPGLPIVNLDDGSERTLLPDGTDVQAVVWSSDAQIIGYLAVSSVSEGYLWAADGRRITDRLGVERGDGWVALPDSIDAPRALETLDLRGAPRVVHRFPIEPATSYAEESFGIGGANVSWLLDGRLAYLSRDGLHVAAKDGSTNRVAGPPADSIVPRQGPPL